MILLTALLLVGLPGMVMSVPAFDPPAYADQRDARLPKLFDALQRAQSAEEAVSLEAVIWNIWAETGKSDLDQLLQAGSLAMTQDDYDTALKDFDKLTKRAPAFAEGWNKRATVNYLMGNYQASLADIDRTLALEPRHFGALAGLGMVNLELDRDEAALDAFQRVLKIDPMNPAARINVETVKQRIKEKSI
ncbi:MAG: tetratricopeptide repeat protein [Dongiaceae bacterium]